MTDDTELLRQVHPSWIQEGRATSQTFRPTPKDGGKLSTYDGDQIFPQASWLHYTETLKLASAGVLAVTIAEFTSESLPAVATPIDGFPEHVSVDYTAFGPGEIEKKSKRLRNKAQARGWRHQAPK